MPNIQLILILGQRRHMTHHYLSNLWKDKTRDPIAANYKIVLDLRSLTRLSWQSNVRLPNNPFSFQLFYPSQIRFSSRIVLLYWYYNFSFQDAPSVITSPQNVTKNETQSVTFQCTVDGKPLTNVTWLFNNVTIDTSDSVKYNVSGPSSANSSNASLTLNNLVRGQEGFYHCKAENSLGSAQSKLAYLTVNCEYNSMPFKWEANIHRTYLLIGLIKTWFFIALVSTS